MKVFRKAGCMWFDRLNVTLMMLLGEPHVPLDERPVVIFRRDGTEVARFADWSALCDALEQRPQN